MSVFHRNERWATQLAAAHRAQLIPFVEDLVDSERDLDQMNDEFVKYVTETRWAKLQPNGEYRMSIDKDVAITLGYLFAVAAAERGEVLDPVGTTLILKPGEQALSEHVARYSSSPPSGSSSAVPAA